ncbi:RNA-binding S4 domain-containing protein [Chromatocurvus halotolerans]|uniref:Heat shock protein 15 n=1 Tax=Chromatocurvus halotolerans TaxID=1132028 RepID=A0A4V2SA59_9GAMM|nr:S4 domain-containing protein [Chromatocurvus halotolerans]TCO70440.1 heat shock protein Hsp15 [Chromatocurvus halotolerans]
MSGDVKNGVRLDKWLWAARFFKTRSLAKAAVEGGKVQFDGNRVKVSREVNVGDRLRIRQGWDEKDVTVIAVSDQRRGAAEAQALYEESADSIERRESAAAARKAAGGMLERPVRKPNKKERRQIHRFRDG